MSEVSDIPVKEETAEETQKPRVPGADGVDIQLGLSGDMPTNEELLRDPRLLGDLYNEYNESLIRQGILPQREPNREEGNGTKLGLLGSEEPNLEEDEILGDTIKFDKTPTGWTAYLPGLEKVFKVSAPTRAEALYELCRGQLGVTLWCLIRGMP